VNDLPGRLAVSRPARRRRRIARIWRGRTPASRAAEYVEFLRRKGLPDYAATPGNRGARLLLRIEGDAAEFLLISYWDDYDAIRRFAGDDLERAVYYPEDDEFLLEKEPTVKHYEVFE
jgi:heme-degrading monooxygenase HmoA